jgi:hypothetical protein
VAADVFTSTGKRFMWWQIDSPLSKHVTNTAARPFDWPFTPNGINRLVVGSPRNPTN